MVWSVQESAVVLAQGTRPRALEPLKVVLHSLVDQSTPLNPTAGSESLSFTWPESLGLVLPSA